ncbi:MAG: FAD-dependent oxidoreductase [Fibrobacter sp.]|nr:FAD-dependent oxidoreductase [Fibrobacter sp.]
MAVRSLKRFVVDRVDPSVWTPAVQPADQNAPKVAVVGAGPAGLAAAHELSLKGYRVTLLEKENRPGGMLTCAIPAYRLPREGLTREIDALLNENIDLRCNQQLGRDFTIETLQEQGHRAVFLAMGSHQSRRLGVTGEDVKGVIPGIEFLKAYNLHGENLAAGHVGIVGGGNSAMDAARVAFRLPGVESVTVFYRRTREEMPAYAEEIEAGLAEGIKIEALVAPVEVLSQGGKLTGVRFIRNELTEIDESGRRSFKAVTGSEFEARVDTLIVAISEQPDLAGVAEDLQRTRWGTLAVNDESLLTTRNGVFAAGDLVTGPATVIEAVAAGKKAAAMIDRYLNGRLLKELRKVRLPSVYIEPVTAEDEDGVVAERPESPHLAVSCRKSFDEVELCIDEATARCEASRCLRCDLEFTHPE